MTYLISMSLMLSLSLIAVTFIQSAMVAQTVSSELAHGVTRVAFILYFITCLFYVKGERVRLTCRWLRRFLIFLGIYGIYQLPAKLLGLPLFLDWLRNDPSFSYYKFDTAGWIGTMRSTSIFAEPSQATIPLVVFFMLNCKCQSGSFSKWLGWTVLVVFAALTFSRTAWVALLVCAITSVVLLSIKNKKTIKAERLVVYSCIVVLSLMLPAWGFLGYKESADQSTQVRSESIVVAVRAIQDDPLIGGGWNSFSIVAPKYDSDLPGNFSLNFIHNMFLSYMQQIGILGYLLALYPFIAVIGFSSAPRWMTYGTLASFLFSAEGGGDIAYAAIMWLWIAILINYERSNVTLQKGTLLLSDSSAALL